MTTADDPKQLFGLRLAHVGINADSTEEAKTIADRFQTLMGLAVSETPKSYFADSYVEVMSGNGRGEHGHIAFHVDDMDAAEAWFEARGFALDQSSRAPYPDGSTHLIYFTEPIAGFSIHLTRD